MNSLEKKRILEDEIKQTKNENQQLLSIREEQTKKIRGLKEELEKLSINHKVKDVLMCSNLLARNYGESKQNG